MLDKLEKNHLPMQPPTEIVVIGAGAAGIGAALSLAERGYKVKLIEQFTLGSGSSGRNPGRMGHGFHYVDKETALTYLRASIQVQRKYPDYLRGGKNLDDNHPLMHGQYFITNDSDNPPEEILETYEAIREEYRRLIAEDPANEVFGPPDRFFRILKPDEYKDDVNMEKVAVGVETAERLFDWPAFAKDIKEKIEQHPNITLYENTEVAELNHGKFNEPRFTIRTESTDGTETCREFKTDYIVNSTWENIEKLNDQLGLRMAPGSRTNRLKCLLVVKLPESLRHANSKFFCMGQHVMYSNLGDGTAMATSAKETNMATFVGLDVDEKTRRLLNGGATEEEKKEIANKMLASISKYIPAMKDAEFVDIKYGIIQTEGKLSLEDLKNPESSFHKRSEHGVREELPGFYSNPLRKLFYWERNAEVVLKLIEAQVKATAELRRLLPSIFAEVEKDQQNPLSPDIKKAIVSHLEQNTSSILKEDLKTGKMSEEGAAKVDEKIVEVMKGKYSFNRDLKERFFSKHQEGKQKVKSIQIDRFKP